MSKSVGFKLAITLPVMSADHEERDGCYRAEMITVRLPKATRCRAAISVRFLVLMIALPLALTMVPLNEIGEPAEVALVTGLETRSCPTKGPSVRWRQCGYGAHTSGLRTHVAGLGMFHDWIDQQAAGPNGPPAESKPARFSLRPSMQCDRLGGREELTDCGDFDNCRESAAFEQSADFAAYCQDPRGGPSRLERCVCVRVSEGIRTPDTQIHNLVL